ncbi:MAG: 3',5'-cyclic-nucleotide phosphodiesterase [Limnobacter sp.]|nr:3',5'-cyclic-nucleotide phosphodiesterase [Limnobacter sp.]
MRKHFTVEVLGCSGSIGIPGEGTTSFLVDDDLLIDAGTGLCQLAFERLEKIDSVLITHSHLDHVCGLPFLVDTVGVKRRAPLQVYAQQATIDALKQHIFNEQIWPDFARIPTPQNPVMQYRVIQPGVAVNFDGRNVLPVAVNHTVPAIGVIIEAQSGGWAFSGDTHETEQMYNLLRSKTGIKYFVVESAFPDRERWLADLSRHLCPELLKQELTKLKEGIEVWITHLKPKAHREIRAELAKIAQEMGTEKALHILSAGKTFRV